MHINTLCFWYSSPPLQTFDQITSDPSYLMMKYLRSTLMALFALGASSSTEPHQLPRVHPSPKDINRSCPETHFSFRLGRNHLHVRVEQRVRWAGKRERDCQPCIQPIKLPFPSVRGAIRICLRQARRRRSHIYGLLVQRPSMHSSNIRRDRLDRALL
jgi:hypothetical protein